MLLKVTIISSMVSLLSCFNENAINMKLILISIFVIFISGCMATSTQVVPKPDLNKPLTDGEAIVKLQRAHSLIGMNATASVYSNNKEIGNIANDDELVWLTTPNPYECISVTFTNLSLKDDTAPVAYKCFKIEPNAVTHLTYDANYPASRVARTFAFLPVFKDSPTFKSKESDVSFKILNSSDYNDEEVNSKLLIAIKEQFGESYSTSSNIVVNINIIEYKKGNAVGRYVVETMAHATLIKAEVEVIKDGQQIESFITRPVISSGGLSTIGADDYIFDEVAEDIYLHLFGNN